MASNNNNIKKPIQKAAQDLNAHVASVASSNPDQFVKAGTDAVKDFLSAGTQEVQKNHEKVMSYGRQQAEKITKNADKTVRGLSEGLALSKDQVDAVIESGKMATDLAKNLHEQWMSDVNTLFAENVELAKETFACRTLNDVLEVQNRALQSNMSLFFNQSARLTDAWLKLATEVGEPISHQTTKASKKFNSALAA